MDNILPARNATVYRERTLVFNVLGREVVLSGFTSSIATCGHHRFSPGDEPPADELVSHHIREIPLI